jgi:hypothetical protein
MARAPPDRLLSLSVNGLQRLKTVHRESDFAFVVGGEHYFCPSFVAEFVSPRVCALRSQDVTIQEFSLETEDPTHYFSTLLSLGLGGEVSLKDGELSFVRSVSRELRNYELFEKARPNGEGRVDLDELKAHISFYSGPESGIDAQAIASRFHELSISDFDELSPSALESIVSDENLVLSSEDSLFEVIHRHSVRNLSYFCLLDYVRFEFLSSSCIRTAFEFISSHFDLITLGIWSGLGPRLALPGAPPGGEHRFLSPKPHSLSHGLESEILSDFPAIFSVFEEQEFRLLYRGSRDGFRAEDVHRCCDNRGRTLTVILSDNDSIFGGYSTLPWTSQGSWVLDSGPKCFLFTIKNPHDLPPRIFARKQGDWAILDKGGIGPTFGGGHDLHVCDQCHTAKGSYTYPGRSYNNDTGLAREVVFTGAQSFLVKQIEVFEVIGAT